MWGLSRTIIQRTGSLCLVRTSLHFPEKSIVINCLYAEMRIGQRLTQMFGTVSKDFFNKIGSAWQRVAAGGSAWQ
jgi:hypothetical protein